jgi:hypothetical protein
MASTRSSTQANPRVDDGVAPTAVENHFTDVEQALATLVHASYPPDARAPGRASERSTDARVSRSFGAGMLGAADLRPPIPREQRSLGTRGIFVRVAIALCLTCAIWAWRSYGGPARDIIATWTSPLGLISARPSADQTAAPQTPDPPPEQAAAPPAVETSASPPVQIASQVASQVASIAQPAMAAANEPGAATAARQQVETSDLAALRQTVEQLAAGQKQLSREIARLQAEKPHADKPPAEKPHADKPPAEKPDNRTLRHEPAHPAAAAAAPARKPRAITPMPPQAARRVSMASPVSPPPQPVPPMPWEPQPSNPPLRPPMPVPQP